MCVCLELFLELHNITGHTHTVITVHIHTHKAEAKLCYVPIKCLFACLLLLLLLLLTIAVGPRRHGFMLTVVQFVCCCSHGNVPHLCQVRF